MAVGGTFDRLHAGHRLLLAASALAAERRLFVGITGDKLLSSKRHAELLQPFEERAAAAVAFARRVRPAAAFAVDVGGERLEAKRFFIDVGARAAIPPFPGLDTIRPLTNASLLELDALPRHLAIVGGSYIGLEFAQIFRRFGAAVTVIERAPRLVPREDADVSEAIREFLQAEGIAVRCGAEIMRFAPRGDDVEIALAGDEVAAEVWIGAADHLPRQVRVVYAKEPAHARYQTVFSDWRLDFPVAPGTFANPKALEAEHIEFALPGAPVAPPETMQPPAEKKP